MFYNPMTCGGWETAAGWIAGGDCLKVRIGFVLLFFIFALVRKWGGEEVGMDFSFLFSLILGLFSYGLIAILFGSFKIAFIVGLLGGLVGGYGAGFVGLSGESSGGDDG